MSATEREPISVEVRVVRDISGVSEGLGRPSGVLLQLPAGWIVIEAKDARRVARALLAAADEFEAGGH